MSKPARTSKGGPRGLVQLTAKEYVDDKVDQSRRELSAKIDGLNMKIDGAVAGLNAKLDGLSAKFDGLSAKMDALLQIVGPLFETVRHLQAKVDTIEEMLTSKGPIGFRADTDKG